jgi:DNA-binding MarR family transcriptional regulator
MNTKESVRDFRKMIRILEREFASELALETSCCGVSLAQCHALLELEALGKVSLSELAEAAGLDKSTLSRTVDSLVRDGLVERLTNDDDRRAVHLSLSKKGRLRADQINGMCDEYYGRLLTVIPKSSHRMVIEAFGLVGNAMTRIRQSGACCVGIKEKKNE